MKYSTVTSYVRASVERALAMMARRPSLVGADELARLGALAFDGPHGDEMQCAVDHLAGRAAFVALGMALDTRAADLESDLEVDRQLLDAGFTIELVKSLRGYADRYAGVTLEREAHARNGNSATRSVETATVRQFIAALLGFAIAAMVRRQLPVSVGDIAKLAATAFAGDEQYQRAVEDIVRAAASQALGIPLATSPTRDAEIDRDLGESTAAALRQYAASTAADIVTATQDGDGATRSVETRAGEEDDDPPLRWRGIWSAGWTYRHGDMATHNGVLWFAKRSTDARPGDGDSGWQLMHKAIARETRPQKSEREAARGSA